MVGGVAKSPENPARRSGNERRYGRKHLGPKRVDGGRDRPRSSQLFSDELQAEIVGPIQNHKCAVGCAGLKGGGERRNLVAEKKRKIHAVETRPMTTHGGKAGVTFRAAGAEKLFERRCEHVSGFSTSGDSCCSVDAGI